MYFMVLTSLLKITQFSEDRILDLYTPIGNISGDWQSKHLSCYDLSISFPHHSISQSTVFARSRT
jgi:hypothetical protein